MRRHRRRFHHRQARHHAQQAKGHDGQKERQRYPCRHRRQHMPVNPAFANGNPALKADGKHQIQRHGLGRSLGHA